MNISGECESALKIKSRPDKKDVDLSQLWMKCWLCGDLVQEGYLCTGRDLFVCLKCNDGWKCHIGEDHEHIRIPGRDELGNYNPVRDHFIDKVAVQSVKDYSNASHLSE